MKRTKEQKNLQFNTFTEPKKNKIPVNSQPKSIPGHVALFTIGYQFTSSAATCSWIEVLIYKYVTQTSEQ